MADLGVTVRPGLVVTVGSGLGVNVDGAVYAAPWWPASYVPTVNDPVRVLICAGEATILGPTIPGRRYATGTVAGAASGGLLPVTINGATVQCQYAGTAPTTGTLVLLSWQSTTPWVINSAAAYTPPPTTNGGPSAPLQSSTTGTLNIAATDSGSWRSIDGWGTSSSRPSAIGTGSVMQGTYSGSNPYSGAWFYGTQAGQLSGATINAIHFRLSARLTLGSYSSALNAHLYVHTSSSKPSGDVNRTAGPADVSLPPGYGGGWIDLPVGWASTLLAGGGIGIYGSPYLGLAGIDNDPASGQLALDWSR